MLRHITFGFLLFVFGSSLTIAQPRMGQMQGNDMRQRADAIMKQLSLSDPQEVQLQKLRLDLMKKQTQLHAKIQSLRIDSKELFLADKIDRKSIESNIKAITDVQEQLKLNMLDHWFAVNTILTPEQQKIWKKHALTLGEDMQQRGRGAMRGACCIGADFR